MRELGQAREVEWRAWGNREGRGTGRDAAPSATVGRVATATVVAIDHGLCDGEYAYRSPWPHHGLTFGKLLALTGPSLVCRADSPPSTTTAGPPSSVAPSSTSVGAAPTLGRAASKPGYQCVPYRQLFQLPALRIASLAVHLGAYTMTYRAPAARDVAWAFSYPGQLAVSTGTQAWVVPKPADPHDVYFRLGQLCMVNFGTTRAPYVLAEGWLGGANCCFGPTIYGYSTSTGAYRVVEDLTKPGVGKGLHWSGYEGFLPDKVGSAVVLESSDGAFPDAFGCYACTPAPTRLFTVADGQLRDVTTHYPEVIRSEASGYWYYAVRGMSSPQSAGDVEGSLAAWAADMCELNEGAQMWQTLQQLQAKGKLTAAARYSLRSKAPFPSQLRAFLSKQGYCDGQLPPAAGG